MGDKLLDIDDLIDAFKSASRIGNEIDEPEGSRYIQISDKLSQRIILSLEEIKKKP